MKTGFRLWRVTQWQLGVLLHQRLAWTLAIATVAFLAIGALLRDFNFGGNEAQFFTELAAAGVMVCGTILIAVLAPTLVLGGIETRGTELLLVHGVRRFELITAQTMALVLIVGWLMLIAAAALAVALAASGHTAAVPMAMRSLTATAAPLLILASAAILLATICGRAVLATTLTLFLAVAGHLAPVLDRAVAQSSGAARVFWAMVDAAVPNLASAASGGLGVAYAVGYSAIYVAGAIWIFSRREL